MTRLNALMLIAVFEANTMPTCCWWNDPCANRLVNDAVRYGWIRRTSTTQIEWTESGADLCRNALATGHPPPSTPASPPLATA